MTTLFETLLNLIYYKLLDNIPIFPIPLNILDIIGCNDTIDFPFCGCLHFHLYIRKLSFKLLDISLLPRVSPRALQICDQKEVWASE